MEYISDTSFICNKWVIFIQHSEKVNLYKSLEKVCRMFPLQLRMKLVLLMAVVLLVIVRDGEQALMSCPESKYSKQMV